MSLYQLNKIMYLLDVDADFLARMKRDPAGAIERFDLTEEERGAVLSGNVGKLYLMGVNAFILDSIARHELLGVDRNSYLAQVRVAAEARKTAGNERAGTTRIAAMEKSAGRPLAGIRVLDFSHVLAGPMCTRLLVDLGAEVLRIESTKRADTPWRSASDPDLKRMYAYIMVHRGKKSITLDLKSNDGGELARKLASVADVVVENFSADVMDRLGLGYDRLSALNPRLIYLSMSGYGHDGPRKDWTSMNSNLQAYSGMMMITEQEGNPPVAVSNSWMDYVGGLHGCYSILQALIRRKRSGKGCNIDMAQFECGVGSIGALLLAGIVNGERPRRLGNRSAGAAPQGCYACAGEDQWCVISVENDEQWQALARILGNAGLAQDARLQSLAGRMRHHDEIDRHIENWTRSLTPAEVARRMQEAGVPAEPMRRMDEVMARRDGSVFHLLPGKERPTLMTGLPFSFAPHRKQQFGQTPRLGEHTDEALQSWLGLKPDAITKLRDAGVLA